MRTHLRKSRGQAAVELALMTVLIIPCFLYILFIDDLLRFRQDLQETVVTSAWDMSVMNYDHQTKNSQMYLPSLPKLPLAPGSLGKISSVGMAARVAEFDRLTFADHTVASPRFDNPAGNLQGDANEEKHHMGVGAHECWLAKGAKEVRCWEEDVNAATNFLPDATLGARGAISSFALNNYGGLSTCKAQIGVLNHWLPNGVLFFSKEELSSRTYHGVSSTNGTELVDYEGGNTHKAAKDGSVYLFPEDRFSIITNPWAMANSDGFNPPGDNSHSGPIYQRVDKVYSSLGPLGMIGLSFITYPMPAAFSDQILNPLTLVDWQFGDNMFTPEVAFTPNYSGGPKADGFFASQWRDWGGDHVQKTYSKRGKWYLGSPSKP